MLSKLPPWMKELMKEFTKPPGFFHHHSAKSDYSTGSQSNATNTPAASSQSSDSNRKRSATARAFGDEASSPTDPPPTRRAGGGNQATSKSATGRSPAQTGKGKTKATPHASIHPNYDLRVLQMYPFVVEQMEAYQTVVKVVTESHGTMAFKLAAVSPEKVMFIYRALQYAKRQKFNRFSPVVTTVQGKPMVSNGPQTYYVTRWIEGNPVDFSSLTQLGQTAETLARFHESTIGFETTGRHPHMAFDLYQRYLERSQYMLSQTRFLQAKSKPSEAEQLILKHATAYAQQASQALSLLKDPIVSKHLDQEEDRPGLCHLDIVERNLVHQKSKRVALIDFDNMTYAPRVLDLAHLIRRGMQKTNWQPEVALVSLINYNGIRPLTHAEYVTLEALLLFPHRWWRLLQLVSNTKSTSVAPIQTFLEQENNRQQFLRSFSRQVTRHKTVS